MFGIGELRKQVEGLTKKIREFPDSYVSKETFESFKRQQTLRGSADSVLQSIVSQLQAKGEDEIRRLVQVTFEADFKPKMAEWVKDALAELDLESTLSEVDLTEVATSVAEKVTVLIREDEEWKTDFLTGLSNSLAEELDWSGLESAVADKLVDRVQVTFNGSGE